MCVSAYVCVCACVYVSVRYIYTYPYIYAYIHIYVYICLYIYVCIHTYIYSYRRATVGGPRAPSAKSKRRKATGVLTKINKKIKRKKKKKPCFRWKISCEKKQKKQKKTSKTVVYGFNFHAVKNKPRQVEMHSKGLHLCTRVCVCVHIRV